MARTRRNQAAIDAATVKQTADDALKGAVYGAIRDSWHGIAAKRSEFDAAENAVDTARDALTGTRAATLQSLAKQADEHDWPAVLIEAGLSQLKASLNDVSEKTWENYAREVKNVCHPKVRKQVGTIYNIVDQAFNADKLESDAVIDRPMKTAFSRRDLLVQKILTAAIKKDRAPPKDKNACVEMAINTLRDNGKYRPDNSQVLIGNEGYSRLAGQLKRAVAALTEISAALGGHGAIDAAAKALSEIDAKSLKTVVETRQGATKTAAHNAANPPKARASKPAAAPAAEPTPIAGVVDIDALIAGVRLLPDSAIAALIARAK